MRCHHFAQATGSPGKSDEQVTAIVFEEQPDGLLSAIEASNELSGGGLGTPPTSPRIIRVES